MQFAGFLLWIISRAHRVEGQIDYGIQKTMENTKKIQNDFTEGAIGKHLIKFSLPFLISNFIQACYSVADMLIVGRYCSTAALAGVNNGAQVCNILTMLISGLTIGGTILVGQYFGAKKEKDISETIGTLFSMMLIIGIVLTGRMIFLNEPIMRLLNVQEDALPYAKDYTAICLCGTLFIFGYNAVSAVQRGMGESKRPLLFVAIACVINIGLDLLFVKGWGIGPKGAALATITSQAISMILAVLYLKKRNFVFDFKLKSFKIKKDKALLLLRIGIPSSVQAVISNFSFLFLNGIVNAMETAASAAVGIVGRFNGFAVLPAIAMSQSISSISAQNIGAGDYKRAKQALWYGLLIAFALGLMVFAFAQLFAEPILNLFMTEESYNPAVVEYGKQYMSTFSIDYLFLPFSFCFNGLLNGAGHTTFTLFNNVFNSIVLRIPVASWLSKTALGISGVGLAAPSASLVGAIISFVYILSGRWMKNATGIRAPEEDKAATAGASAEEKESLSKEETISVEEG